MTFKERDENCYCADFSETSSLICHVCEEYHEENAEQYEIDRRKYIQERNEY